MKSKREYTVEAARLARVIDIAISAFQLYPPVQWNEQQLAQFSKVYADIKRAALHPAFAYRKLAALDHHTHDILVPFQESVGEAVEYFWQQVQLENLGCERVDKLRKVLASNKIKS